jgi:NAD(P)H-flavin reductase
MEPVDGGTPAFRAGQFNMLTAFGVGEVPVSTSSAPGVPGPIEHTVRDVGAVTHALCASEVGTVVGVRGPFGTDWGVSQPTDEDVVVVAGGIGVAPLRGVVRQMVGDGRRGRVIVLVGARSPDQVVFGDDLEQWRRAGAEVQVTVDVADTSWTGPVGVVTTLLASEELEPERTTALICGPEVMMRFTARALLDMGIPSERIRISLERNMQCGIGLCGHCQLGPLLLCRDGPVVTYGGVVSHLLSERER